MGWIRKLNRLLKKSVFVFQKLWVLDKKFLKTANGEWKHFAACLTMLFVRSTWYIFAVSVKINRCFLVTPIWRFEDIIKIIMSAKYNVLKKIINLENLYCKFHRKHTIVTKFITSLLNIVLCYANKTNLEHVKFRKIVLLSIFTVCLCIMILKIRYNIRKSRKTIHIF